MCLGFIKSLANVQGSRRSQDSAFESSKFDGNLAFSLARVTAWFESLSQAELAFLAPPGADFQIGQATRTTVINWAIW